MRISDWSSDVCSSDLHYPFTLKGERTADPPLRLRNDTRFAPARTPPTPPARFTPSPARFVSLGVALAVLCAFKLHTVSIRSEEHTSELQSLMRISYAVFCLKKKKKKNIQS